MHLSKPKSWIFALFSMAVFARGQVAEPVPPVMPTSIAECEKLTAVYERLTTTIHENARQCMSQHEGVVVDAAGYYTANLVGIAFIQRPCVYPIEEQARVLRNRWTACNKCQEQVTRYGIVKDIAKREAQELADKMLHRAPRKDDPLSASGDAYSTVNKAAREIGREALDGQTIPKAIVDKAIEEIGKIHEGALQQLDASFDDIKHLGDFQESNDEVVPEKSHPRTSPRKQARQEDVSEARLRELLFTAMLAAQVRALAAQSQNQPSNVAAPPYDASRAFCAAPSFRQYNPEKCK